MRLKCLAILATGFILAGCHRGTRPVVVSAPPAIVPVVVPVATPVPVPFDIPDSLAPKPPTPPSLLEQAELAFALGNIPKPYGPMRLFPPESRVTGLVPSRYQNLRKRRSKVKAGLRS